MITKKFKISTIQNNDDYIECKLGKSIPKGIIIYYSLVFIIYASILDKNVKKLFLDFSFFSFSKNLNYLNICFFRGLTGLGVYALDYEALKRSFSRPLVRPLRPQPMSKTTHYSQIKLSQLKIQNSENFGNNIRDKNQSLTTKSHCQTFADNSINAICSTIAIARNFVEVI